MSDQIYEFIFQQLEARKPLKRDAEFENLNYMNSGHIDSFGLLKFITAIEKRFNIEIEDEDMMQPSFRVVHGLVDIVRRKITQ
ncbi:MAG: acyl carrier protein [Deltaproteobacteria bacterium]|nr:acyl carrier protein [Deltaproteobacteria bacterium]